MDVAALVKLAGALGPQPAQLLGDLGLDRLTAVVLYSGFEGEAEGRLIEIDQSKPGKGLLGLLHGPAFRASDVPPLPADVSSWTMANFDAAGLYELVFQVLADVARLTSPGGVAEIEAARKQIDDALGVSVRDDLLAQLGPRMVLYQSPAEGPFNLGQTLLFKIKDPRKLQDALNRALKALARISGTDIRIKKRAYHGATLREVHVRLEGFIFVPTYTVHGDWLVVGFFPQPVQGYVLRSAGALPCWKPDARVQAALERLPHDAMAVSVSDPRPTVRQLLSLAPVVGGAIKSFAPEAYFDVGTIPNAHEAAAHLFPNVSAVTAEGNTLRVETRASLALPVDLNGLDNYGVIALFVLAGRLF
jgi:hypothetical protein